MMHGHEKSDSVIVAVKPANKAGANAAESAEPRTGTKGNAGQQSTRRAQNRVSVSQALDRIRQVEPSVHSAATHPRWEPYAGKPHVRFCAGGREATRVPTATPEAIRVVVGRARIVGLGTYCSASLERRKEAPSRGEQRRPLVVT
jgi:hypothetical protein